MNFKKSRVKQIITAVKTVKDSFKQLENEKVDDIKHFYLMSIKDNLNIIQNYLESLADERPDELDKLKADYNNLLERYKGLRKLKKENDDLFNEYIREGNTEGRFSLFSRSELNSIALALEAFNKDYNGIMNESQYKKLMNEIKQQKEV